MGHGPGSFDCAIWIGAVAVDRPWFFTKQLIEALLEEQQARTRRNERGPWGAVVFICSLHANVVIGEPHYGTSKAAVAQLTRELAWKFGPNGIRVNSISPGWIRTRARPARWPLAAAP
jgi:NAD(P)-dependent dehydrogenase (short-subunit alcohol dehydrogenase family)